MPSSHTVLVYYFLSTLLLGMGSTYSLIPVSRPSLRLLVSLLLIIYSVCATSWRIFNEMHTPLQVAVGAALGLLIGTGWHFLQPSLENKLAPLLTPRPWTVIAALLLAGALI
eukprot:Platyproteum_vivax@DN11299_c0_g1_i1.p1